MPNIKRSLALIAALSWTGSLQAESVDDGLRADIAAIAKEKGITLAESARRTRLIDKINVYFASYSDEPRVVNARIISDKNQFFAEFQITRYYAAIFNSSKLMKDQDLSQIIRVRIAPYSRTVLDRLGDLIFDTLKGQQFSSEIDPDTGKLIVKLKDVNAGVALLTPMRIDEMIIVKKMTEFPVPVDMLNGYMGGWPRSGNDNRG